MRKKKINVHYNIIGEPQSLYSSSLKLINLSEKEANLLARIVCEDEGLPIHTVLYSKRKTKDTYASYSAELSRINIYQDSGNIHMILHELAHIKYPDHDKMWLRTLKMYINLWRKKWRKMI